MKKIDLDTKFKTYGDIANEKGEKTGKMSPDTKLVAEKLNELIDKLQGDELTYLILK